MIDYFNYVIELTDLLHIFKQINKQASRNRNMYIINFQMNR